MTFVEPLVIDGQGVDKFEVVWPFMNRKVKVETLYMGREFIRYCRIGLGLGRGIWAQKKESCCGKCAVGNKKRGRDYC
jgi:hypothetical protein